MFRQSGITSTCVNVMSKSVKFVLDLKGWNDFCKSEWMHEVLNETAENIVSAHPDYAYRTHNASFTALTNIYPGTEEAAEDNWKNKTLLKIVGG